MFRINYGAAESAFYDLSRTNCKLELSRCHKEIVVLIRLKVEFVDSYDSAGPLGQGHFLSTRVVRLPSVCFLRVTTQFNEVHSPLADELRSHCSTYQLH